MKRNIYLEDIPLEEAHSAFQTAVTAVNQWQPLQKEEIPLSNANGRTSANAIFAKISSPHYHRRASLLLPQIRSVFSVVAPCRARASTPTMATLFSSRPQAPR
jgi:hypothetical protein